MRKLFFWHTRVWPFYIAEFEGRFHPVFRDESLGGYHSAASAADDLAGGHTFSIPGGIDTGDLGIPSDINEWQVFQARQRTAFITLDDPSAGTTGTKG